MLLSDNANYRGDTFISKSRTADLKKVWSKVTRYSSCKEWLSRLGLSTETKSRAHGVQERKGM